MREPVCPGKTGPYNSNPEPVGLWWDVESVKDALWHHVGFGQSGMGFWKGLQSAILLSLLCWAVVVAIAGLISWFWR
jgi:hypothetical protein